MALALLAAAWATARGGEAVGLIVDHGLRAESALEAREAASRLARHGIRSQILTLGLAHGPALSVRARTARYTALEAACAGQGIVHLLLGHHANDQAETIVMRAMAGSHAAGRSGMAAIVETNLTRWLRPLLMVPPGRLRATLRIEGMDWCEDPSNLDPAFVRSRLRVYRADIDGNSAATAVLSDAARAQGHMRAAREHEVSAWLACHAHIHPVGYATIPNEALPPEALGALIRTVSGARRPPRAGLPELARDPRAATLGGVRIVPGGRLAPGRWLLVREARAMSADIPAMPGLPWDNRFRLAASARLPHGATLGALGEDVARLQDNDLPAVLRRTLPALRVNGTLFAVPHLCYPNSQICARATVSFTPALPAACAPFKKTPDGWVGTVMRGCQSANATLC